MTKTEVVRASEMHDKVILGIARLRDEEFAAAEKAFPRKLKAYEKKLNGRKEVVGEKNVGRYFKAKAKGFYELEDGEPVFTARPGKPDRLAYRYRAYQPGPYGDHAKQLGLLPDSRYNRDVRNARVEEYAEAMAAGEWRDLLSDPIAITADGQVVNGQHRLAALSLVDFSEDAGTANDPAFLVVWGVDPSEAVFADGSHRTAKDETTIARKVASGLTAKEA